MANWFVSINEVIQGPFETEELRSRASNGSIGQEALVWGRGQVKWSPLALWMKSLGDGTGEIYSAATQATGTAVTSLDPNWHFAFQGATKGPMKRERLIEELKQIGQGVDNVMLWTKGMKGWAPVYEFYDIADELDINRRQYPRATLPGKVIARSGEASFEGDLQTLSEGGFGAMGLDNLIAGEKYQIEIQSSDMRASVNVVAQLRYVSESGYCGFRFENLTSEGRAIIIQALRLIQPGGRRVA